MDIMPATSKEALIRIPIVISLYSHGKQKLFILAGRSGEFIILKLYKKVDFPL